MQDIKWRHKVGSAPGPYFLLTHRASLPDSVGVVVNGEGRNVGSYFVNLNFAKSLIRKTKPATDRMFEYIKWMEVIISCFYFCCFLVAQRYFNVPDLQIYSYLCTLPCSHLSVKCLRIAGWATWILRTTILDYHSPTWILCFLELSM